MKLIVGLGNPGEKYQKTRHNMGFLVLDKLLEDFSSLKKTFWEEDKSLKSLVASVNIAGNGSILAKPQTYMNNSGEAVKRLINKYKLSSVDVLIIHDDIDLPLGKIRVRMGGAAAGHRGVESIIEDLATDKFLRIRIGIGRPIKTQSFARHRTDLESDRVSKGSKFHVQSSQSVDDFVLSPFTSSETGKVRTTLRETGRAIRLLSKEGIDKYMAKYNKK